MSNGGRRHVSHSRYTNRPQTLHTRLWRGPIGPAKHAFAAREAVKCCWWAQAPSGCNGALVQGRNQFFDASTINEWNGSNEWEGVIDLDRAINSFACVSDGNTCSCPDRAWACQVRYVIDRDVCKPTSDSNT